MRTAWIGLGLLQVVLPGTAILGLLFEATKGLVFNYTLFPLAYAFSLIGFVIYPNIARPGSLFSIDAYLDFARGGRTGCFISAVILAVSLPLLRANSSVFEVGVTMVFLYMGGSWLPSLSAFGFYAYRITSGEDPSWFFKRTGKFSPEGIVNLTLATLGGLSTVLRDWSANLALLVILISLYIRGWIQLSLLGASLAGEVGVTVTLAVIASAMFTLRRLVAGERRRKLFDLVSSSAHPVKGRGGRAGYLIMWFWTTLIAALIIIA